MSENLDHITPENYQRAFFFKNLGYLVMSLCMAHYRKRDFLAIYTNEMAGTYISNSAARKAAQIGKEIFSNEENFKVFGGGFRDVIKEMKTYIVKAKQIESIHIGDFYDLWALVVKQYYYFEKTEFFFTDECYKGEMSETLKKNLLVLGEDLKMESRPLFVELISTVLYHFVELVAKKHNMNVEDIKFYNFEEMVHLLESEEAVAKEIVNERKNSYTVYCEHEHIIPIMGRDKATILERFKEKDYSTVTEFKGIVANKGKITARALVILPELNIPYEIFVKKLYSVEMDRGDILVTETTSPDFVPLMKKAGGIIANQGGMNSHAAIMSRELKIPCLVGTYHATDILKTGDLIELDANIGTVRILEKNN
jgi:phosphohistidine swiveling domain-containing protein